MFQGRDANLYAYAGNDPVNMTDPSGKVAPLPALLAGIAVGVGVSLAIDLYRGKPLGDTLKGLWTELVPCDDAVGLATDPDQIREIKNGDFSQFNPARGDWASRVSRNMDAASQAHARQ